MVSAFFLGMWIGLVETAFTMYGFIPVSNLLHVSVGRVVMAVTGKRTYYERKQKFYETWTKRMESNMENGIGDKDAMEESKMA